MKRIHVIAVAYLVIVIAIGSWGYVTLIKEPPDVEIISTRDRTGLVDGDFSVWIDVSVYNKGGGGRVVVRVSVTQEINSWRRAQPIFLGGISRKI